MWSRIFWNVGGPLMGVRLRLEALIGWCIFGIRLHGGYFISFLATLDRLTNVCSTQLNPSLDLAAVINRYILGRSEFSFLHFNGTILFVFVNVNSLHDFMFLWVLFCVLFHLLTLCSLGIDGNLSGLHVISCFLGVVSCICWMDYLFLFQWLWLNQEWNRMICCVTRENKLFIFFVESMRPILVITFGILI